MSSPFDPPQAWVDVVKDFEGCHRYHHGDGMYHPYVCPAGYWTIGYGRLCSPEHPPITREQAEAMLMQDLPRYMRDALKQSPCLWMASEPRRIAIADFCYNAGATKYRSSQLKKAVDREDWAEAAKQVQRWIYGGGRILPGLVKRRAWAAHMLSEK